LGFAAIAGGINAVYATEPRARQVAMLDRLGDRGPGDLVFADRFVRSALEGRDPRAQPAPRSARCERQI
jgi:hypothetical protein